MRRVIELSRLGWNADRGSELPAGTEPGRVARVDRGRLRVLTADGERTAVPGSALHDEIGLAGPAVGDWVALRGELAVGVLPRRSAATSKVISRTEPSAEAASRRRSSATTRSTMGRPWSAHHEGFFSSAATRTCRSGVDRRRAISTTSASVRIPSRPS